MSFGVSNIEATISLKEYLLLTSKVLVFLGFLFQMPNVMLILGFMELVTKQSLKAKRNYVYVAFAVASAILTPPDVITMMALWVPLVALYEIGIWAVALIVHPYLKKKYLPA
jgi:sec-independent protein translocase protein TatC